MPQKMFQITGGSGLKVSEFGTNISFHRFRSGTNNWKWIHWQAKGLTPMLLETTFGEPKIYRMRVQDDEHFGFL